ALHLIGGQTLLAQQHLQRPRLGSANAQAVVQTLLFEEVATALQVGDTQRCGGTAERGEQEQRKQQGTGSHGRLRKQELGIATRPPERRSTATDRRSFKTGTDNPPAATPAAPQRNW